jgi:hypothetical protein
MPNGWVMIRRCAGSSAARLLLGARPRRARWAVSRRDGSPPKRTFPPLLIFRGKVSEVKSTLTEMFNASNAKLDTIHSLVNSQLSQAVDRLTAATNEIEELKQLVRELQKAR